MKKDPPKEGENSIWHRVRQAAREVDVRDVLDRVGSEIGKAVVPGRESGSGARRVANIPVTTFSDVGGLADAKRELEAVCVALSRPESYRRWGARPPKGVLLYGPPGTGKTLLARCVAGQARAAFFQLRAV